MNHYLSGTTRTVQYGYDDANHSNNRLWALRTITPASSENNKGEVFSYDPADQVSAFQLDVLNPNQVSQPLSQRMVYDPNGNRQFTPTAQYAAANDLSQYTTRTIGGTTTTASYDPKGNTTTGLDGSVYIYDAQNRLHSAQKSGGPTMSFTYDGLNRQVSRTIGADGTPTFSVWDGWDLVEDYHMSVNNAAVADANYVYGATGLVRDMESPNHYYYQDASGNTSHLANNSGTLLEWYRYDVDGNPVFYDANDTQRSPNQSSYGVRHLFTGQQWYQEVGVYDLRNRFYSPDLGRFLQPDPIGFWGDRSNLYRYCGNNPVTRWDPLGHDSGTPAKLPDPYSSDPEYYTGSPPNPWEVGNNTEENPSSFGADENDWTERGIVSGDGPLDNWPGANDAGAPPPIFYGANTGPGGIPSEAGSTPRGGPGQGTSPGGLPGTLPPNGPPGAAPVSMPMSQVIAKMSKYRLEIDPNKIIVPVTTQFASYDVVPFGDAIYYGASTYALVGLGGIAGGEALAGTAVANMTAQDLGAQAANAYLLNVPFWTEFAETVSPGSLPSTLYTSGPFWGSAATLAGGKAWQWYRGY